MHVHSFHYSRLLSFIGIVGCLRNSLCKKKSGEGCLTWILHFPFIPALGLCSAAEAFPPALAELGLKIISKNTRAIFTIAGHSGISRCFLRLVPNSFFFKIRLHIRALNQRAWLWEGWILPRSMGVPRTQSRWARGMSQRLLSSALEAAMWAEGGRFAGAACQKLVGITGAAAFKHLLTRCPCPRDMCLGDLAVSKAICSFWWKDNENWEFYSGWCYGEPGELVPGAVGCRSLPRLASPGRCPLVFSTKI